MTIVKHELRQGKLAFAIWTAAIAFLLAVCVFMFPEMKGEMDAVGDMFASMGSFSAAFGMDQLNFGEFIGFFGVECGNVLGLGGAFFAALLGISALAGEEKEHTAEFLLTHPVSRKSVVLQKLTAVVLQITFLNLAVIAVTALSVAVIGETADIGKLALLFLAYYIMQLEVVAVTFGISAFLRRGSLGIGLGLAAVFYFLNIISNLIDETKFLKYITPFGYTDSAYIISNSALDGGYLAAGICIGVISVLIAFWKYDRKDL